MKPSPAATGSTGHTKGLDGDERPHTDASISVSSVTSGKSEVEMQSSEYSVGGEVEN